ncbi:MAG: response regulator [Treponema sp.]|nr:response regulator [Treponema sp.]
MKLTKMNTANKDEIPQEIAAQTDPAKVYAEFNYNVLRDLLFFSTFVLLMLACFSFVPGLYRLETVFNTWAKMLYIVSFFVCLGWFAFVNLFKKFSFRHSKIQVYIFFSFCYFLGIFLNMNTPLPQPFVLVIGFRILAAVLIRDSSIRSEIFNNIIIIFAVFFVSFTYKPTDVFLIDVIDASLFTSLSMVLSSIFKKNERRYSEMTVKLFNSEIEVEKAKNSAKTSFMANMSHEIRTPINSIMGLNEMLIRETKEPKVLEYARNIKSSSNTLLKIVSDILDFSKIESGKMEIINAEYELSSVVTDLINMISPRIKDKNLEFKLNINPGIPHLLNGDEIRVKQCMLNLLTNAAKYTDAGTITMTMDYETKDENTIDLIFRVKDTGIGIKQEDIPKLFTVFERLDERRNRTIEGSGLGLNIVSMLLGLMGTKLEVKSEYGSGSEFSFRVEQKVVWWDPIGDFDESYENYLQGLEEYKEAFHAPEAKILIVDDTKMNIIVAVGLLKDTQIQVDTALSAQEMFELVCKKHYDVIFLDHRMPNVDGVEAFHLMKAMDGNLCMDTPVVALTANVVSGAREFYIKEGFADYLAKPVDSDKIEKILIKLLPPSLVHRTVGGMSDKNRGAENEIVFANSADAKDSKIPQGLSGIDFETAMQNCGDEDILLIALKEYYNNIPKRAADIEYYASKKDFKNYTIQTHALKSSSKLIGAMELSEQAAYLEKCGDEKNDEEIQAKTPALLTLYRSYVEKLSPIYPRNSSQQDGESSGKELIEEQKFSEAMSALREYAQSFDFNAADSIVQMLDGYEIPDSKKEFYEQIKQYIRSGDSAAIVEALKEC